MEMQGMIVYKHLARFAVLRNQNKMVRVDMEMPHLEGVRQNSHVIQLISLKKLERFSQPEHPYVKAVLDQYHRTYATLSDVDGITAIYKPLDPGTFIYRLHDIWVKLDKSSQLLMRFEAKDQMSREIDRNLANGHITMLSRIEEEKARPEYQHFLTLLNIHAVGSSGVN